MKKKLKIFCLIKVTAQLEVVTMVAAAATPTTASIPATTAVAAMETEAMEATEEAVVGATLASMTVAATEAMTLTRATSTATRLAPATMVRCKNEITNHYTLLLNNLFFAVTVHCKDTRIVVNVNTNRPFSGRIYSLGRSETCNVDVINSDSFRLDLTMSGQDCNTQSVVSIEKYQSNQKDTTGLNGSANFHDAFVPKSMTYTVLQ